MLVMRYRDVHTSIVLFQTQTLPSLSVLNGPQSDIWGGGEGGKAETCKLTSIRRLLLLNHKSCWPS
jgi:hypothetical protein